MSSVIFHRDILFSIIWFQVHCRPNMTCLNPCNPDRTSPYLLPCILSQETPHFVQSCYFQPAISQPASDLPAEEAEEQASLAQRSFVEGAHMCSVSQQESCPVYSELDQVQRQLDSVTSRAARLLRSAHHTEGCDRRDNLQFYAMDVVIWADMASKLGVNRTDRDYTEVLVKVDSTEGEISRFDLTNSTGKVEAKFREFIKEDSTQNAQHRHVRSAINPTKSSENKPAFIQEISRVDLLSIQMHREHDFLIFVNTKWCGYCHVLRRKLEVLARLLTSQNLKLTSIDSDINRLNGTLIPVSRLPALFILPMSSNTPHSFPLPATAPSVSSLIMFITRHLPDTSFSSSHTPVPLSAPAVPCTTWVPAPGPEVLYPTEGMAYSEVSLMDVLEGGTAQGYDMDIILGRAKSLPSQSDPSDIVEINFVELFSKTVKSLKEQNIHVELKKDGTLKINRDTRPSATYVADIRQREKCRSTTTMFGTLATQSGFEPYENHGSSSVVTAMIFSLDKLGCFAAGHTRAMWDLLGSACGTQALDSLPCGYLLAANEIGNHQEGTPDDVEALLGVKLQLRDLKEKRDGVEGVGYEVDKFHLKHCYNVDSEMVYYLRQACSQLCRMPCRIINRLQIVS